MAANVSVPYDFVASTPAVADNVDADFAALVTWINANAVHLDGAKAFTGVPSGPATDPTLANHLVRKSYMDAIATPIKVGVRRAANQSIPNATPTNIQWDTEDFDVSGFIAVTSQTFTVPASSGGTYAFTIKVTQAVPHVGTVFIVDGSGNILATAGSNGTSPDVTASSNAYVAVASQFAVTYVQSSGSAQNVTARLTATRLTS